MNRGLNHYALLHPEYPNETLPDIEYWVTLSEYLYNESSKFTYDFCSVREVVYSSIGIPS